jgi:hypothetical protein
MVLTPLDLGFSVDGRISFHVGMYRTNQFYSFVHLVSYQTAFPPFTKVIPAWFVGTVHQIFLPLSFLPHRLNVFAVWYVVRFFRNASLFSNTCIPSRSIWLYSTASAWLFLHLDLIFLPFQLHVVTFFHPFYQFLVYKNVTYIPLNISPKIPFLSPIKHCTPLSFLFNLVC